MELNQLQKIRKAFLLELYKTTGGDRWNTPIMFAIGHSIGITDSVTESIVDFLVQKGFVKYETKERDISITINGVEEAEKYLSQKLTHKEMSIKEIQSLRNLYLIKLYDKTGGNRWEFPNMNEVGESLSLDKSVTAKIVDYLDQKGLIKIETLSGDISITSEGIDVVESLLENENKRISHDELITNLDEINRKLDLLSLGQEIIYEDVIDRLDRDGSIQKKDLKLLLLSTFISKGLDSIKLAKIFDIL
jgi:DNA-binding MarR family transcriptional regulator